MWGLYRLWVLPTLELAFGMGSSKVLYQNTTATRNLGLATPSQAIENERRRSEVWAGHELEPRGATTTIATMSNSADANDLGK